MVVDGTGTRRGGSGPFFDVNDSASMAPNSATYLNRFTQVVNTDPMKTALVSEAGSLSYGELNERSDDLAAYLRSRCPNGNKYIGICFEKSFDAIVSILAILKAGHAYVPIDINFPDKRKLDLLARAELRYVLTYRGYEGALLRDYFEVIYSDQTVEANEGGVSDSRGAADISYILFTSGTTGSPKGVVMPDSALSNLIDWQAQFDFLGESVCTLQFASYSFDVSFQEIFTTLCFGGVLAIASEECRTNYKKLARFVHDFSISRVFLPYSVLEGLLSHINQMEHSLRVIVSAGEPLYLSQQLLNYCLSRDCQLINHYGPTESHVVSQYIVDLKNKCSGDYIPIGKNIDGVEFSLFEKKVVEDGGFLEGELVISGDALARGYLLDNDMTQLKFPEVYVNEKKVRGYRTGDIVRMDSDECFYFVGRLDEQIKLNGIRVEPKEIECILMENENIERAVVLCEKSGSSVLCFAFLLGGVNRPDFLEIKKWLGPRLPAYMHPNKYFSVDKFPTTPNGKLDRQALLSLTTIASSDKTSESRLGCDALTLAFMDTWSSYLKTDTVGIDQNFFELGGSSLLAMKIFGAVEERLGIYFRLSMIFKYPTIRELVTSFRSDSSPPEKPSGLSGELESEDRRLASFAQLQMWIESERFDSDYTYNTPIIISIGAGLCVGSLKRSFRHVVSHHIVLSSCYQFDGDDLFHVAYKGACFDLEILNDVQETDVEGIVEERAKHSFDLLNERPIIAVLICLRSGGYVLLINIHHIAVDEWSYGILLEQLDQSYIAYLNGFSERPRADNTREVAIPIVLEEEHKTDSRYAVFAREQRDSEDLAQVGWWLDLLSGASPELGFENGHAIFGEKKNIGETYHYDLPKSVSEGIVSLSRDMSISLYSCLLGLYVILLHRIGGKNDITVGTPISLRDNSDYQDVIGCFLNTIAIRVILDKDAPISQVLKRTADALSNAIEHKNVPFERVVQALTPQRSMDGSSIFSSMFVMRDDHHANMRAFGGECRVDDVFLDVAKFDLTTFVKWETGNIRLSIEYRPGVIDDVIIESLASGFELIALQACHDSMSSLGGLQVSPNDQAAVNFVSDTTPSISVYEAFSRGLLSWSDKIAISFQDRDISYKELDLDANRFAGFLKTKNISKGDRVGLLADHKIPEYIAAMLGTLKIGAVYVPLDVGSPKERIKYVVEDASCSIVFVEHTGLYCDSESPVFQFDEAFSDVKGEFSYEVAPDDLASVMYTSGSTGKPKGVMVPHRGIVRLATEVNYVSAVAESRFLHLAPSAFDASTFEVWLPLLNGGASVQYPYKDLRLESFGDFLLAKKVSVLWLGSSLFNTVIDTYPNALSSIKQLLVGGESLSVSHINKALTLLPDTQIINGYGPTENTTFTCCYPVPKGELLVGGSVPIGKPIQDTSVFILNENLQPLPNGVPGELFVGGKGVALGYLNLPGLTHEKFLTNPFSMDGKIYRTGDVCRILEDGNVEFIGRRDTQLKVHGRRIELAEVELAIERCDLVLQSHVGVKVMEGHKEIVAFVVFDKCVNVLTSIGDLRYFLSDILPSYMIPSHLSAVKELPLTANGKVDSARLLEGWSSACEGDTASKSEHDPDLTDIEIVVTGVIARNLSLKKISVLDNFFELGGNSLLAIRIISEVYASTGVRLVLANFFTAETIRALVECGSLDVAKNASISVLFSDVELRPCITVFHNVALSNKLFQELGKDYSVLGMLCEKHQFIVGALENGRRVDVKLDEFVNEYYALLKKSKQRGPYVFVGHSYGGLIAFELAAYMREMGEQVECVFLLDTLFPSAVRTSPLRTLGGYFSTLGHWFIKKVSSRRKEYTTVNTGLAELYGNLMRNYDGPNSRYSGKVVLFRSSESVAKLCKRPDFGWGEFLTKAPILRDIEGDHFGIIQNENISKLATAINLDLSSASNS